VVGGKDRPDNRADCRPPATDAPLALTRCSFRVIVFLSINGATGANRTVCKARTENIHFSGADTS